MRLLADGLSQRPASKIKQAYKTSNGKMFQGRIEDALEAEQFKQLKGKVNLIVTSPPFPLVCKKRYGNENGEVYLKWLESLASPLADLLTEDGSIVIEIGNAWEAGAPIMSTLPLEALFAFKKAARLNLCQHVICHNPARLPSPAGPSQRLVHPCLVDVPRGISEGGQQESSEPLQQGNEEAPEVPEI
jgi:hypothetical protein